MSAAATTPRSASTTREPGWVEHDPAEIWESAVRVIAGALAAARIEAGQINAIGITNQRETTILWDRASGEPVHRAIVWQDRRTAEACAALVRQGLEETVRDKTGLVIDPYFSASKIEWLLDHVDGLRPRAERGEIAFGTVDSWLVWRLTGGAVHATDYSNASRTMLYNIRRLDWDDELLEAFAIPRAILPEVRAVVRMLRQHRPRSASSAPPSPSAASPATSRRRCSARPATARAWPRTPMAPARSC